MTSNPSDGDDGRGGYGKPPKAHRFKPGQSGNPRGRPKEKKNQTLYDAIRKHLQEPIPLTVDGKRRTMSRVDLIGTQLVNKAATGDLKAVETLIKLEKNAPAPDRFAELGGAADRLAQKLRLIQERRKKRAHDGQDESRQGPSDETPSVTGDTVEIERPRDGTGGGHLGGASTLQNSSPDVASNPANQPEATEGGGPGAATGTPHHVSERIKNEE